MNFKERGVTVGDLLLFIILIIVIYFVSLKFKEDKQQSSLLKETQASKVLIFKR